MLRSHMAEAKVTREDLQLPTGKERGGAEPFKAVSVHRGEGMSRRRAG